MTNNILPGPVEATEIEKYLPHRYPFLLVDRVNEIDDEKVLAHKNISLNEPQFAGHFPGNPVMPGVMIVEAMAQAGAILANHCGNFDPQKQALFFMAVDKARFRRPVRPGDRLDLDVRPLRKGSKVWKLKGLAHVDGELVAEAEMMATMTDKETAT